MDPGGERISGLHRAYVVLGALFHLAAAMLVAVSSLVAPAWGVLVLWAVWGIAAWWAWRRWRTSMFAPLIAAGATAVFWVAFINFGDLVLGWTA
jgi:hypothetical protein